MFFSFWAAIKSKFSFLPVLILALTAYWHFEPRRGMGKDIFHGPEKNDVFHGPMKNDVFHGPEKNDVFHGPMKDDVFHGPEKNDVFHGP